MAPDHFPLTKEQALTQAFTWLDPQKSEYETTFSAGDIPDSITEIKDDILKEIIKCESCGRAYRLIAPELNFLRQSRIPAPRTCVDCRHSTRISYRNKAKIYQRNCACAGQKSSTRIYSNSTKHFHGENPCPNEFETSYAPDRPEIVYCESCYNSEVV